MKIKIVIIIMAIILIIPVSAMATSSINTKIYNGIDVSNWQGYIDYTKVKQSGIEIVYIKASQGFSIIDSYFKINYENAKRNGLKIGFYHYLTAQNVEEAVKQAEFFASVISNTTPDCKLAMDFEQFGGLSIEDINNISVAFLEKLEKITSKKTIIYSDSYNAKNVFGIELAEKYSLWVAEYGVGNPEKTNWEYWEGFQYSNSGEIAGINGKVDVDNFSQEIFLNDLNIISKNGNEGNYNYDVTYDVKRGDTLSLIASKYNTTVSELIKLNNIINSNLIYIGEKIIVPVNRNYYNEVLYEPKHIIYIVRKGDTLSMIAQKFKTTINSIANLNQIKNINLIYVGQRLKIENNLN